MREWIRVDRSNAHKLSPTLIKILTSSKSMKVSESACEVADKRYRELQLSSSLINSHDWSNAHKLSSTLIKI